MGLGKLLGKLIGGGSGGENAAPEAEEAVEYKGYLISAAPMREGGQYRTAGTISKQIEGELKSVQFIRADNHSERESAVTHAEGKARQIIDEQGDTIFQRDHV